MENDRIGRRRRCHLGRRLYRLFVAATLLGIALPVVAIVFKSSPDYDAWLQTLRQHTFRPEELAYRGLRSVVALFPALFELSWHDRSSPPRFLDYYAHYVRYNAFVLAVALLWRRRILGLLQRVAEWMRRPDHRRERRTIVAAAAALVFAFQTKAFYGFYWPGIAGWTMRVYGPTIADEPPVATVESVDLSQHPYLSQAIVPEHARYLPRSGYLTKPAMFLHFESGAVLPGNHELVEVVFPNYAFGSYWGEIREPQVFARTVQASLRNRRANRRFLLPIQVSYPNHSPYMFIDYRGYPPADTLERISFWSLTIFVHEHDDDGRRDVELVAAVMERILDVP